MKKKIEISYPYLILLNKTIDIRELTLFLFLPILSFIEQLRIIFSLRIIFISHLSDLTGFSPYNSIQYLFYKTQSLNLSKFGVKGVSKYIGGGDYELKNWWHLSPLISKLFSLSPVIVVLIFSSVIQVTIIYHDPQNPLSYLCLISSLYIIIFFRNINYNVIGASFLPFAFYSMYGQDILIFLLSSFFLSIISITFFVIMSPIVFIFSIYTENYFFILLHCLMALIPFFRILYLNNWKIKKDTFWFLGMHSKTSKIKSKIKREEIGKFTLAKSYLIITYFLGILIFINEDYLYLSIYLTIISLLIINEFIFKFSDIENILGMMCIFLLIFVQTLSINDIFQIIGISLLLNPIPRSLGAGNFIKFDPIKVINTKSFLDSIYFDYVKKVKPNSTVFYLHPDPMGKYENIYYGQRHYMETISYVSNKNQIIFYPDWWAIFKNNNSDQRAFWHYDMSDISDLKKDFKFDYFITTKIDRIMKAKYNLISKIPISDLYVKNLLLPNGYKNEALETQKIIWYLWKLK